MRNWSGMITDHDGSAMATYGLAIPVNSLLINRPQIEFSARDRFDSWMREELLEPLKHTEPRIYAWLIDHVRQLSSEESRGGKSESVSVDLGGSWIMKKK